MQGEGLATAPTSCARLYGDPYPLGEVDGGVDGKGNWEEGLGGKTVEGMQNET